MEKQLAEVVDGTEIKEITETARPENEFSGSSDKNAGEPHSLSSRNLCSCENDGASNMVSSEMTTHVETVILMTRCGLNDK